MFASVMFAVKKATSVSLPKIPFQKMAERVLGKKYELSLVVCGDSLAQRMNRRYRPGRSGKKSYRPNVLSFPLTKSSGEIFLNAACAAREAKKYKVSLTARLALLYVHGLFHLKGLDHGARMERLERAMLKKFGLIK